MYFGTSAPHRDGRVRVEVIDDVLEPSYECSARIRKIFYQNLEPGGYNWKSVSQETQRFYFEEFKKFFVWKQEDCIINDGWLANARRKYSEVISVAHSNWEKNKKEDIRIGKNIYVGWIEFWKYEEFQKLSLIQKNNRHSEVDGLHSTHTSGSASHRLLATRLKIQYKRVPTADQLFYETHTRHATGQPVDNNALFLEAVGGLDKKKKVYGVGLSKRLFYPSNNKPCMSSFAGEEENQRLKRQLIEMNDRMKAMEN
ncbi:uncharacterized protein LOC141665973 [Apium graveolens]|uniref:uncharacterized protein LOC141665973 n=1 Tax=Apium graveolens TaxID=4045 RepID=UPI003D798A8A